LRHAFLHDIAKGGRGSLDAGARIAGGSAAARIECPDTDSLPGWVEVHLVMSTVAQSRDLSDRKTIENFAAVVQSLERLKLLTILTIADIRASGRAGGTAGKAQLLRTLYYETEPVLTGGFSEVNRAQRVAMAQTEFRAELMDWPAERRSTPDVERLYRRIGSKVDLPAQAGDASFVRRPSRRRDARHQCRL